VVGSAVKKPHSSGKSTLGREVHLAFDEVEAHAADAGCVQVLKFAIGDAAPDRGNAARLAAAVDAGIGHRAVVGAVAGGLHDHVARKTQVVAQGVELGFRSVAWRVLALGRKRKLLAGAEDMAVRIDAACGQLETGFAGTGGPVHPARRFGEFHRDFQKNSQAFS